MDNEVMSPVFSNTGYGTEFRLSFLTYRDLPLDNLQFYYWRVRPWILGCPEAWRSDGFFYYGGRKDWISNSFSIGPSVAASATQLQVAIGAVDMCGVWCGIYGTGVCHSHAPLIDEVKVQ